MEFRVLRYFLAVVREESITAAAESLHITQPTLSRQLMDLEEELGTKLLIRGGRSQKIVLTEKGLLLRRRAEEMVDLADKTQMEMRVDDTDIGGDLSIGGGETDAMRLIARTARELRELYPHIHYHLFSGNAEEVKERLDKGLLDFGVFIGPSSFKKYDSFLLPSAGIWGLLVRKDDPLASRNSLTPDDLMRLPLIVSRQRLGSSLFSQWLGADPALLDIAATYNLVYNASLMVSEGVGYALSLDKLVNTSESSNLRFIPLEPLLEVGTHIAWKKYQPYSKAAELFLERLQKKSGNQAGTQD